MSLEEGVTQLRATAHPVRLRILSLLSGTSMSAADIARELEISQANASYHVRVLAASGLLEETGTRSVRGGTARLYTHPWERGAAHSKGGFAAMIEALADELRRRTGLRIEGGPEMLTDAEMWVTPEVWGEVVEHAVAASDLLHGSAQPPRTPGTMRVNMTAAMFAMSAAASDARS